ncbi:MULTISPECIES: 3-oxoadipate enol-lactonase [unclassified Streptomyces]|uniref:3-oxoadipate enol-lactonase n=1 Tax=unclassified Streptomyces TaxID=2593676 RepID=UPI00136DF894|nr:MULTISPECIES: 3-oxoadipate enol-lactonase [unclassified Streptomyces]NEA01506.1 3-oxoadipate enol-lactonase [Streptomyces sp. SID10116]MYY87045.1 3-oxoadipate enol-lactonase [Streptomyces sp. SID335]MYZ13528.1 3-oxoadipate enol-lactonase [Streptomyces sp. SID337]NDZ89534.1 3-oxoadipate enol-lactonase [Streptomyces sp. SID10115]NEB49687.1 3-oxoadipate enol-lactonase [Streptomyces sp. SID339]
MPSRTPAAITTGDGVRLAYRFDGDEHKPVLLLSNSIGTDLHMWDGQVPALTEHFRLLRYDARGHGASDVPGGPYSLDRLGRDVVELLDALGLQRVHVLGLSLGGIVAQWLGIHVPERVDRLVLSNTAAHLGPANQWDQPIAELLEAPDMRVTADRFLHNWFPAHMLRGDDEVVEGFRRTLLATRREGVAGSWAAVRDSDLRRTATLIPNPTLVIAGEHDTVTSAAHGKELAATVPGARFTVLPTVHMANVEAQEQFLDAVIGFLTEGS